MKACVFGCLALLLATSSNAAVTAAVTKMKTKITPVQKVIQMMTSMKEKSIAEKQEDEIAFSKQKMFCEMTAAEKEAAITDANDEMKVLSADIEGYTAEADRLAKEIAAHEEDIATWEGDKKAATGVRTIEKADYDKTHKDYSESIDALKRAIDVVKKGAQNKPQLLQMDKALPEHARQVLASFIELAQDPLATQPPEANAYESSSGPIIAMFNKMLDDFIQQRTDLEKTEFESKSAYELLMQDLAAQLDQAATDKDAKSEAKASALQSKANSEGDLEDTTGTRDADQKYLTDLTADCEEKATTFANGVKMRTDEVAALDKAIEIISGGAVSGAADKHLPSLIDDTVAASFAQLRSETYSPSQARTAKFLQMKAEQLHSRVLSAIATRASSDPFAKVKKMIKDLIIKLMEEAHEEAEHKGWCDKELSTNKQTREKKTEDVLTLTAEIDELGASIAKLTEDITKLTQGVADLDKAMAEATALRDEEKAKNQATMSDAAAAQTAVGQALTVLEEFYAKAAQHAALLQSKEEEDDSVSEALDEAADAPAAQNAGGVIGMLEVIQSDFARLEATTKAAEEGAVKEYEDFMLDSKMDHTKKSTDLEHKSAKKQDQMDTLTLKKEDLEGTQKELTAAIAYYEKLKPDCVDTGVTYEDKVAKRKEEIESLQEALKILNGEDFSV